MLWLTSRFAADRRGATAIEYSLIAALIALVILTGVASLGQAIQGRYNNIAAATK